MPRRMRRREAESIAFVWGCGERLFSAGNDASHQCNAWHRLSKARPGLSGQIVTRR